MRNWQPLQVHDLLLLGSVGLLLFSQQFFLVQALRYINAGLLSPMSYFTIVFAGVFGWLLWSETPDMRTFRGGSGPVQWRVDLADRQKTRGCRQASSDAPDCPLEWLMALSTNPRHNRLWWSFRYAWKSDLIDDG